MVPARIASRASNISRVRKALSVHVAEFVRSAPFRSSVRRAFVGFLSDESGQGLVEYALILLFCSVLAIIGFGFFGKKSVNSFNNALLVNSLDN